jgi:hypothetical protein
LRAANTFFWRNRLVYWWSMTFSENRYPPRIKSGAGFFGIMLYEAKNLDTNPGERNRTSGGSYRDQAQVPADTRLCMSSCRTCCATNDA